MGAVALVFGLRALSQVIGDTFKRLTTSSALQMLTIKTK